MERRDFIKNSLLATGAISIALTEQSCNPSGSSGSSSTNAARKDDGVDTVKAPLRKSIMWGTVGLEGSVLDKCKAIKAAGYEGIEPNSHMDRNEVIDALKATGLKASSVCNNKHWQLLLSHADEAVRRQGIEAQIVAMEDAQAYGTDAVLLVPGRVDENTSYEDCWNRSTACIKELAPVAEKMKIKICVENVWNNFLLSPMEMRMYLNQFNSPYIVSYFDCGNILVYGWPEHWIATLGKQIGRIHIKEFSREIADKQGRWAGFGVSLTEGNVRWKEVMAEIRKHYTGGWLTTEQGSSKTLEDLQDLNARFDKLLAS